MPGYVIHLSVGKSYIYNHTEITDVNRFLKGIIMPDMLPKPSSHFGDTTATPNLNLYIDSHKMDDDFNRGYFLHLITDYLFYTKFLKDFEWSPELYDDYDRLNRPLIAKYQIEVPEEIQSVIQFKDGPLKFLELDSICRFIETVGKINISELIQNRQYDNVYDMQKEDDYLK